MEHKEILKAVRAMQAVAPHASRGSLAHLVDGMDLSANARMAVCHAADEGVEFPDPMVWWSS